VVALALAGLNAPPANAGAQIRPHQHFIGLVNGTKRDSVVFTVCPDRISPGETGPVAGGQKMAVERRAGGAGYTGPFAQIYSWFVPTATSSQPTMLEFTRYGVAQTIPTSIRVPCSGTGQVEFSSCPYLAPCAAGWVADYVKVRFENIAA
jgi:hypothetical protein